MIFYTFDDAKAKIFTDIELYHIINILVAA